MTQPFLAGLGRALVRGGLWLCLAGAAVASDAPLQVAPGPDVPLAMAANCRDPRPGALVVERDTMTFTLHPGDIGGCRSDATGARPHDSAPHMERIEARSPYLARGAAYRLMLDLRVSGDHASGPDTSVLQVHQWHPRRCACSPPLMLGFDARGQMVARLLIGQGRHRRMVLPGLTRQDLADRWVHLAVEIENVAGFAALVLQVDGRRVLSERVLIEPDGALFLKTGLYRRGRTDAALPVDRVAVRALRIARIDPPR